MNPGPIPANGAILFDPGARLEPALPEVHMSGTGGDVPGTVVPVESSPALVAFRPTAPLSPGTYHVSITCGSELLAFDVDVVESMVETPFELTLVPRVDRAEWIGGARACCGGTPTTGDGCIDVEMVEYHRFSAEVSSPLAPTEAGQYVYRVLDAPPAEPDPSGMSWEGYDRGWQAPGDLATLFWPYAVSSSPSYCVTMEALSLVSGATLETTRCAPADDAPLAHRPREDYSGLTIEACPLPPPGYEEQWCSGLWGECDYELAFRSPSSREAQVAACADYYRLCPKPSLPTAEAASPPPPLASHDRGAFACGVAPAPASSLSPLARPGLVALMLGVLRCRRLRRRNVVPAPFARNISEQNRAESAGRLQHARPCRFAASTSARRARSASGS